MLKYITLMLLPLLLWFQDPTATPEVAAQEAGDTRTDAQNVEQVWVPAGCFQMGTTPEQTKVIFDQSPPAWVRAEIPSEQPQHEVCLTEGYWIDQTEVTHASFQAFLADMAISPSVRCVQKFILKISASTGHWKFDSGFINVIANMQERWG